VVGVVSFFLVIDSAFLGANLIKIPRGGWFPLVGALILFTMMTTWKRGSWLVITHEHELEQRLEPLLERIKTDPPVRVPGTAVFLSAKSTSAPAALLANMQYNGVLRERVLLTTVTTHEVPYLPPSKRLQVKALGEGLYQVIVHFGYMEKPDVPRALQHLTLPGEVFDPALVPYFVNLTRVIASKLPGMAIWREQLYSLMRRNAASAADFFNLPPTQVFEIRTIIEM
jgi:KUP system potassium uptake protein